MAPNPVLGRASCSLRMRRFVYRCQNWTRRTTMAIDSEKWIGNRCEFGAGLLRPITSAGYSIVWDFSRSVLSPGRTGGGAGAPASTPSPRPAANRRRDRS